jgi:hypothetical protein
MNNSNFTNESIITLRKIEEELRKQNEIRSSLREKNDTSFSGLINGGLEEVKKSPFFTFFSICGSIGGFVAFILATITTSEKLKNNKQVKVLVDNAVILTWVIVASIILFVVISALLTWCNNKRNKTPETELSEINEEKPPESITTQQSQPS